MKAAEAYARDRVANYLNKQVASSLPAGTGTSVFATIDLGSAAYDYSRAENDKQRTYAGSRVAIAGYALLGGPAAPVLAAVLLAASLVEGGLEASHQAEMLRIYKEIQENYARVVEIQRLQLQVEWLQFRGLIATATGALAEYSTNIQRFKQNCSKAEKIVDLEALDGCVTALARGVLAARLFVSTVDTMEGWQSQESTLFADLSKATEFKFQDLVDARSAAQKALQDIGPRTSSIVASFSLVASELVISGALQQPQFSTSEWVHMNCIDVAMSHARFGTELLLRANALGDRVASLNARSYIRGVDTYKVSVCSTLGGRADTSPFGAVLLRWNEMVGSTRAGVAKTFGLR